MAETKECYVCNGIEPDWISKRCEEHDVCTSCGILRKDLKQTPWGAKGGFLCCPCEEERKLQAVADYKYNENFHEYEREIKCPYCGSEYFVDDHYSLYEDDNLEEIECGNCGNEFSCQTYVSTKFTTKRIQQKKESII